MRFFDYSGRTLYAPAGEPEGGGAAVLDGGLPHEHDDGDEGEGDEPAVTETPEQKRIAALEADLAAERDERKRAQDDAKFWSSRRPAGDDEPGARVGEEPEELTEEQQAAAALRDKLTPEQQLEMLTRDGLGPTLKALGYVTAEQMQREIREAEVRGERKMGALTADQRYEAMLAEEFPDIITDSNLVAAGKAPKTDLFRRAGEHYREAIALDPQLKGSKSALLNATRLAAAELGIKKGTRSQPQQQGRQQPEPRVDNRPSRRDRIDAQRVPENVDEANEEEAGPTNDQLHVAKMLGVSAKEVVKHRGGPANGRGSVPARRGRN